MSEGIATRPPSIAEDIKQRKPFRTRSQEAYLGLVRAGDDLKRRTSAILEAAGVTLQQYNVLRILRGAGDDGLPTLTIAERMIERTPGGTLLLGFGSAENRKYRGWYFDDIADDQGKDWVDTAFDLVLAERGRIGTIFFMMSEENVAL
ncbi:MAG: hypothetical protein VX815_19435 [Gemmatimonadota bacterium]|nr:hypothetical protein [Gemmatimonadota bacterium]